MGLRVAVLIAAFGAVMLVGALGLAFLPKRRGPRAILVGSLAAILVLASVGAFLLPLATTVNAPVSDGLSLYYVGRACQQVALFGPSCAPSDSLHALQARDGTVRWQQPVPSVGGASSGAADFEALFGGPFLFADGVIYAVHVETSRTPSAGAPQFVLAAVRARDGVETWRTTLRGKPAALQIADGNLYIFSPNGASSAGVQVLRASDGTQVRDGRFPAGEGSFIIADGTVYGCDVQFGGASTASQLIAQRASDGQELWRTPLPAGDPKTALCSFAAGNGTVYVTQPGAGEVAALRGSDGVPLWHARVPNPVNLRLGGATLYVASQSIFTPSADQSGPASADHLLALRASDGALQWDHAFPPRDSRQPPVLLQPTPVGDTVYVGGTQLTALRASDGIQVWQRTPSGDFGYGAPQVAEGVVFVQAGVTGFSPFGGVSGSGFLAVSSTDGQLYWQTAATSGGFAIGTA